MKFKDFLIIAPAAFVLFACASSDDEENKASTAPKSSISGTVVSNAPTDNGGTTTPPTGPTPNPGTPGCNPNLDPAYFGNVTGVGPYTPSTGQSMASNAPTVDFHGLVIHADQKLRVVIKPTNGGGNFPYAKMALRVGLYKNGVLQAYKDIGTEKDSTNFTKGIPNETMTDATLLDFSGYAMAASTPTGWSIRISNVSNDYKCNVNCTVAAACTNPEDPYCTYSGGWKYIYEYHSKSYGWCCGTVLQSCQSKQCGVGPAHTSGPWSAEVYVETDSTRCVGQ